VKKAEAIQAVLREIECQRYGNGACFASIDNAKSVHDWLEEIDLAMRCLNEQAAIAQVLPERWGGGTSVMTLAALDLAASAAGLVECIMRRERLGGRR
jgi:hypothetical protein